MVMIDTKDESIKLVANADRINLSKIGIKEVTWPPQYNSENIDIISKFLCGQAIEDALATTPEQLSIRDSFIGRDWITDFRYYEDKEKYKIRLYTRESFQARGSVMAIYGFRRLSKYLPPTLSIERTDYQIISLKNFLNTDSEYIFLNTFVLARKNDLLSLAAEIPKWDIPKITEDDEPNLKNFNYYYYGFMPLGVVCQPLGRHMSG